MERSIDVAFGWFTRLPAALLMRGRRRIIVTVDSDSSTPSLQFGTVTLIPDERLVLRDGRPVPFTPKAFDLLAVLAGNPGRLLTKEYLMQAVWPDTVVEESNLTYNIFAIRKALGESSDSGGYIETVPRRGYRFVAPVVRVEAGGREPSASRNSTSGPIEHPGVTHLPSVGRTATEQTADVPSSLWSVRKPSSWGLLVAGLAVAALVVIALRQRSTRPLATTPIHFQEPVAGRLAETGSFSVSPDGRHLVFAAEGADGILQLWLRTFSKLRPVPLPGTGVFTIVPNAVWSPDSRFVAFDATGALKRVGLDGGAPQSICEGSEIPVGGSWNREGVIVLGNPLGGLVRCNASGGRIAVATVPDESGTEVHVFPSFLSNGRHFVYLRVSRGKPELSGIYVGELDTTSPGVGNRLITTGFGAAFVAAADSGSGLIVFARNGALFAQRLDERRLAMIGDPIQIADTVGSYLAGAYFSVSPTTLVYRSPNPDFQLTWFDRDGREVGRVGTPARISGLALSPDGDRALVTVYAPQGTARQNLWLFDLSRSGIRRPVTFGPELARGTVWSTNDRFVVGTGGGASGVYQQAVGGQRQLLMQTGRPEVPTSMTPDGRILLYTTPAGPATGGEVWVRIGAGDSASPRPFLRAERDQGEAQLSPDRRWVAYVSNEAGPTEVFVTEFRFDSVAGTASAGESLRLSEGGGFAPRWRRDGRELLYLTPDGSVMTIEVETQRGFRPRPAKRLFKVPGVIPAWGLTRNGDRFLFAVPVSPPPPFNIVQNWQAMLPK